MICSFMFQVRSEAVGVRQQKDADAVGRALKCSDERLAAHAHVCFAIHAEAGLCAAGICVQPRRVAGRGSQLDALLGHRGAATVSLLFALSDGAKRFGVLRSQMGRMSQKTLVAELRALEQLGAVERIVFAEIPPRVEYSLTAAGEELVPLLRAVETWCARRTGRVE